MASTDDLRGSAPVLTTKDVLLEVRSDVKAMATKVDVLVSQNLNERVSNLEKAQWRIAALAGSLGAIAGALAGKIPSL